MFVEWRSFIQSNQYLRYYYRPRTQATAVSPYAVVNWRARGYGALFHRTQITSTPPVTGLTSHLEWGIP